MGELAKLSVTAGVTYEPTARVAEADDAFVPAFSVVTASAAMLYG
jgi:hypothetical protein